MSDPTCDVCGKPILPTEKSTYIKAAARHCHIECWADERRSYRERQVEQWVARHRADRKKEKDGE